MKRKLVFLVFIISSFNLFSQSTWLPGYVITIKGDTIRGLIKDKNSLPSLKECHFKIEDEATQKFSPQDIKGYKYEKGIYYVSKNISKNDTADYVFLEFIVKGEISFYRYIKNKDNFYFIEKEGKLYSLEESHKQTYEQYKRMLIYVLQDPQMIEDINNTELSADGLTQLALSYHSKIYPNKECIIYKEEDKPYTLKFGIYMGAGMATQSLSDYTPGKNIQLGLKFEITEIFKSDNISLNIDANLLKSYRYANPNELSDLRYILKVPIGLNYYLSKSALKPYIGFGLQEEIVLNQENNSDQEDYYFAIGKSILNYQSGIYGKFGLDYRINKIRTFFIEINSESTIGIAPHGKLTIPINNYYLNLGVKF